jgi:tetratricopeptide (TPR) repeat protein
MGSRSNAIVEGKAPGDGCVPVSRFVAGARGLRWPSLASVAIIMMSAAAALHAQADNATTSALTRALDLETAGKCREAIPLYRQALHGGDPTSVVLGLERCYSQIGRSDSLLPLVDTLLADRPTDPTLRTIQLRTLDGLRRFADAEAAFDRWVAVSPREAGPYREYARLLLDGGRAAAADTVLRSAVQVLGGSRDLAAEFAQMQGALGLWVASAVSWREAGETLPYLEQAAVFALYPAPEDKRDSVRAVLAAPPVTLGARRVLAGLESRWRSSREGWRVLSAVPPTDSAVQAWIEFAGDAEGNESWLTARDAYAQAASRRPNDPSLVIRAATAALNGGEPRSALALLASAPGAADGSTLLLEVRAMSALGQATGIEALLAGDRGRRLDEGSRQQAQRALAWAWIRAGDLGRARVALDAAGGGTEEDERAEGWLALYRGDLKTARGALRRTDETSRDVLTAMALLSRTRADTAPAVGGAFLSLARGDTATAARQFVEGATQVGDAAPFALGLAARLYAAAADTARATTLWQSLVERYVEAPEAAEAELEWARVLRARGQAQLAVSHLEHMILTYPQSALVPQARRELDLVKGSVPPDHS